MIGRSHWTLISRDLKDKLLVIVPEVALKQHRATVLIWAAKDEAKNFNWEAGRGTLKKAYPGLYAEGGAVRVFACVCWSGACVCVSVLEPVHFVFDTHVFVRALRSVCVLFSGRADGG